jgi:tetratricopeptide (TPR) repeat protein
LAIVIHPRGNLAEALILYEESLEMCQRAGEKWNTAHVLLNIGHIAYEQRNFSKARTLYEEDLRLCRELGDRDGQAYAMSGLAHLLCEDGDWVHAARLQGAVVSLLTEVGTLLEPIEQSHFDKTTIILKEKLGEENYQREVETGQLLPLEEAINLAQRKS